MKKAVTMILCSCLLFAVAACAPDSGPATTADSPSSTLVATGESDEAVTLRFAWWGGEARHEATLEVIEMWSAKNPHVTIEGEFGGWDGYHERIATQIAGGTVADIVQTVPARLLEFGSRRDIFVDLYDQDIFDLSGFDLAFSENFGMLGDRLIGVPTGVNAYSMFFNRVMMDRIGIPIPEYLTWDGMFELAAQIQAVNPNYFLMINDSDGKNHMTRTFMRQLTGEWPIVEWQVNADRDSLIEMFRLVRRWLDEGVTVPMEIAFPYYGRMHENRMWHLGQIAMMYASASGIGGLWGDNIDIVPVNIPILPNAIESGAIAQPSQMLSVTNVGNEVEALRFVDFFFNDLDAAKVLRDSRGIPPTVNARELLAESGLLDPVISQSVNDTLPITDEPIPPVSEGAEMYRVLFEIWEALSFNVITPEEAADRYLIEVTRLLEELEVMAD